MKQDESIERLLRRARPGPPSPGGVGPCLDAETLAAWVDGGLTASQIGQAELHVSSCARCQAMVAATMTSAPMAGATAEERPARSWGFGWLVPLTAGVAAVGLWFMVPSRTSLNNAPPEASARLESQVAQAPVEAAPEPRDRQAPEPTITRPSAELDRRDASREIVNERAKEETVTVQGVDEKIVGARQDAAAKNTADTSSLAKDAASPPAIAPRPAAPAPASAPAAAIGLSAAPPRAGLSAIAADRLANFQAAAIEVVSSNPSSRWRISSGGFIEHSIDAGSTWTRQSPGISVDFLAGSSPSPDVCWIVGRAGTVLRTIDGGQRWQRVTSPGGLDLQAVTATDASTAEVTAADGRRFQTVDAGISWR